MTTRRLFLLLLSFMVCHLPSAYSQTIVAHFERDWKRVDSLLLQQHLPQTATKYIQAIYTKAKQQKQQDGVVKALVYQAFLATTANADEPYAGIQFWYNALEKASGLEKALLHHQLAIDLFQIWQQEQYQILSRANTSSTSKDPRRWSASDFLLNIHQHFQAALQPKQALQQAKLQQWKAVLVDIGNNHYRKTLYELLIHNAIEFYANDRAGILQPKASFNITDPGALGNAAVFAHLSFNTKDTLSSHYQIIKLYQQLTQFLIAQNDTNALLDADIKRANWVWQHQQIPNADEHYLTYQTEILHHYYAYPETALIEYQRAKQAQQQGELEESLPNKAIKTGYNEAIAWCNKAILHAPKSEGGQLAQQLKQAIEHQKTLQLFLPQVQLPAEPILAKIEYRQTPKAYLRILSAAAVDKINPNKKKDKDYWLTLQAIPAVYQLELSLPDNGDRHTKSAEFMLPEMPKGNYYCLLSDNERFEKDNQQISLYQFQISQLAALHQHQQVWIVDRKSGKPLPGATIKYGSRNYENGAFTAVSWQSTISDKNGYANLKQQHYPYQIIFKHQTDSLLWQNPNIGPEWRDPNLNWRYKERMFAFTDRKIYRLGQTVFFKIIIAQPGHDEILPNFPAGKTIELQLKNGNGQTIQQASFTTNEFGSISGKFVLPSNGLSGNYSIQSKEIGVHHFKVEDYKRPRFFIQLSSSLPQLNLGDTITINGIANAFAGYPIQQAQVKYTVERTAVSIHPYPIHYAKMAPMQNQSIIVSSGTIETDEAGQFSFQFPTKQTKTEGPTTYYQFTIRAEVIDRTGESHDQLLSIRLGENPFLMATSWNDIKTFEANDNLHIDINTKNLDNKPVQMPIQIEIAALTLPTQAYRKRYWSAADTVLMSKENFVAHFPLDAYKNEDQYSEWPIKKSLSIIQDSSNKTIHLPALASGVYKLTIRAFTIKGDTLLVTRYLHKRNSDGSSAYPQLFDLHFAKGKITTLPQSIPWKLWMPQSDAYLLFQKEKNQPNWFAGKRGNITGNIPFTNEDKGGTNSAWIAVSNNRLFSEQMNWEIPFPASLLAVKVNSFRNKVLPGAKEIWEIQIHHQDSSPARNAELVAAMYDASLDKIYPNQWRLPNWWLSTFQQDGFLPFQGFGFDIANTQNSWYSPSYFENAIGNIYPKLLTTPYLQQRYWHYANYPIQLRLAGKLKENEVLKEVVMAGSSKEMASDIAAASIEQSKEQTITPPFIPNQTRTNFAETAFFYPHLISNDSGKVAFTFQLPEATTQWQAQLFAHQKNGAFGYEKATIITQKELMVQPNLPRFLREGDRIKLSTALINISDSATTGTIQLQLVDAITNTPVDGWFQNVFYQQYFSVEAKQTTIIEFPIEVPYGYTKPVIIRLNAQTKTHQDGESHILPVLTNKTLVQTAIPLWMDGNGTKTIPLQSIIQKQGDEISNQQVTIQYNTNPAWIALSTLPYLNQYPYACSEQLFNQFFANQLFNHITQQQPSIAKGLEQWLQDSTHRKSPLEQNESLQQISLTETPWQQVAADEDAALAALYQGLLNGSTATSNQKIWQQLQERQLNDGSINWYGSSTGDPFITQYIAIGLGKLHQLNALPDSYFKTVFVTKLVHYLDQQLIKAADNYKLYKINSIPSLQLQLLYARSFYSHIPLSKATHQAIITLLNLNSKNYFSTSYYNNATQILIWYRYGKQMKQPQWMQQAIALSKAVKENAIADPEKGTYWSAMQQGLYWHQQPITTMTQLLLAFQEVTNDQYIINGIKTWLIRNKQTNHWSTTIATAEAAFAILMGSKTWLTVPANASIQLGNKVFSTEDRTASNSNSISATLSAKDIAQIKTDGKLIVSGNVNTSSKSNPSYGAIHWQYLTDQPTATTIGKSLVIQKECYKKTVTDDGEQYEQVNAATDVRVGERLLIRLTISTDRPMEYVHVKDNRAAGMEPIDQLSRYQSQGNLSYYASPKDAAQHFFIDHLPSGTHTIEYTVVLQQKGSLRNGIAQIQCMYAPTYTANSNYFTLQVN